MKNKISKLYFTLICFFLNFVIFANLPGDGSEDGGLESGDTPIDSYLILLLIAGVLFVFKIYKKNKQLQ